MNAGDNPDDLLSLPAAAELAGVHYMTAYRWVRTCRLKAEKSGGTWKVHLDDLRALTDGDSSAETSRHRPDGGHGGRITPMTEALMRGDQGGAWLLVEESRRAGVGPVDVLCELIEPAMTEIGRRWKHGEATIVDEHRATTVVSRLLGRLGPTVTRAGRSRGSIAVGAVEGNRHGFGAAFVADVFRSEGYDVSDLGADVPAEEFAAIARDSAPLAALCLSVSVDGAQRTVERTIASVKQMDDVPVLVGGTGVPNALWAAAVGADGWCADGRDAPALLARLVAKGAEGRRSAPLR